MVEGGGMIQRNEEEEKSEKERKRRKACRHVFVEKTGPHHVSWDPNLVTCATHGPSWDCTLSSYQLYSSVSPASVKSCLKDE